MLVPLLLSVPNNLMYPSSTISNDQSPSYVNKVRIEFRFPELQTVRFDVLDVDTGADSIRVLGHVTVAVGEVFSAAGHSKSFKIWNRQVTPEEEQTLMPAGSLRIDMFELRESNATVKFGFDACNLERMDWFGSSDP
jgi:hypothetical protein